MELSYHDPVMSNEKNITKETVMDLDPAPWPSPGDVLQVRLGKVKTLGNEPSGIFKTECKEPIYVGPTGLGGDEHVYKIHGGTERALMQYASEHYADWRHDESPKPYLFDYGAFGENIVGTGMSEANVCVGDRFRIGKDVVVEVSEPRNPCYKLNIRFEWPRALKRVQRTARVGWLYRVVKTGKIQPGDRIVLEERPNPRWSLLNTKRVLQGKLVALSLAKELTQVDVLTDFVKEMAFKKLYMMSKVYRLARSEKVAPRVKKLTFELDEPVTVQHPAFEQFAFAQISFGKDDAWRRSYSIVSGDMNKFLLGVALDDHSRGGSAYIHHELKVGDKIKMAPGGPKPMEEVEETICGKGDVKHLVIIGGIGVTAFLPSIEEWERDGADYEIHYAVRSVPEAAFLDRMPAKRTHVYAKADSQRLNLKEVIPPPYSHGTGRTKVYCCGPSGLMAGCEQRTTELDYPSDLTHFESFGSAPGSKNADDAFEVLVNDLDSKREATLQVPPEQSLLRTVREAGFEVTSFCEAGACGACRVTLCEGKVRHVGTGLPESDRSTAMLACIDRGVGKIKVELD